MKKIYVILLCCAVLVLIVGVSFGASRLLNRTTDALVNSQPSSSGGSSNTDGSVRTWFAAELPGAEQLLFRDFNSADDLNKGGVFVYNGTTTESYEGMLDNLNTDNGYLEYRYYGGIYPGDMVFFPSYDTKDLTAVPDVSADVVVIDFDMWHPQGTPRTTFCVDGFNTEFAFRNGYYTDFNESGGVGDPVNNYCVNCWNVYSCDYDSGIYDLGGDFSRRLHITVMVFDTRVNYYLEGVLFYSTGLKDDAFSYLVISGFSDNISPNLAVFEDLEYGSFCIDNLEMVKFGDGNGSYNGVLMQFKANDKLKISDILEVEK